MWPFWGWSPCIISTTWICVAGKIDSGAWQWVAQYRNVHYVNISVIWNKQSKTSSFLPHAVYYCAVLWSRAKPCKACVTSAGRTGRSKTWFVFSSAVLYPCWARRWSLPNFSFSTASCEWFQLTGPWRDNEQSSLQCWEWGGPFCERETDLSHCFSPIAWSVEKQQESKMMTVAKMGFCTSRNSCITWRPIEIQDHSYWEVAKFPFQLIRSTSAPDFLPNKNEAY